MTDETPQNARTGLPPVRMALRVKARHAHQGPHLARAVVDARAPKHLGASTRLSRHPAADMPAAPPAPAAGPPAAALAPGAEPASAAVPAAFEAPDDPALSDFAKQFLFGDASAATAG